MIIKMEEIDLKELFQLFWNKKIPMICIVILCMIIGIVYSFVFVEPEYTSSTTLVLTKADSTTTPTEPTGSITTSDVTLNSQLVSTYSELAKSKKVLRAVISNLQSDIEEEELRKSIEVSSVKDTELIEINVTNTDAAVASQIANEIAKVFTENVVEIYSINNVHIVDQAEPSNAPSNVNHLKDIVIFAFVGLVVAVMYVLIINMLDTTVKSVEDIERLCHLPVLVSIPIYDYDEDIKKGGKKV